MDLSSSEPLFTSASSCLVSLLQFFHSLSAFAHKRVMQTFPKPSIRPYDFPRRKASILLLPLSERTRVNFSSCLSSLFPSSSGCANSDLCLSHTTAKLMWALMALITDSPYLEISVAIGRTVISVRPLPTPILKSSRRRSTVYLPNREIFSISL